MRQAEQVAVISPSGASQSWQIIRTLRRVREEETETDTFVAELPSIYATNGHRARTTPDGYELDGMLFQPATEADRYEAALERMNRQARLEGVVIW